MDGFMENTDKLIYTDMDMERRVLELGFLPFFRCGIRGFSIEEMTAPELWFPMKKTVRGNGRAP